MRKLIKGLLLVALWQLISVAITVLYYLGRQENETFWQIHLNVAVVIGIIALWLIAFFVLVDNLLRK